MAVLRYFAVPAYLPRLTQRRLGTKGGTPFWVREQTVSYLTRGLPPLSRRTIRLEDEHLFD